MNKPFPLITDEILKAMNERWPERCPELDWDQAKIWHYAGQRSVVRYLNEMFKEQREVQL
jgi:hypothetical protein